MADKTGYIGRSPSDSTTVIARQSFSVGISTDSFSFNSGYTPGYVDVYINGVKLIDVSDFSATDGSNITLLTAANNGDVVEVVAYKAFNIGSISDTPGNFNVGNVLTAQSGSVTGNFTVGGVLTYEDVNNVDSIGVVTARTGVDVLAGGVDITGGGLKVVGVTSLTGNTVVSNNADVTISSGSSVTTAEHFYFNDGKKANFGNDSDLQIYHNDTSGYIDNNKGALYIRNNVDNDDGGNIIIQSKSGESAAVFQDDEGVRLYYDGSEKFATTGGGVDVTGITTSDGFYATSVGVGTALFVEGDARVTGILTVGTASISIDGNVAYPSIRPVLDLNFAASKTLDRRITFTRDGQGTYVGKDGLVKYATNNTPRFDHDPATGESLGLLIEKSRTNILGLTSNLAGDGGTNWDGVGGSISANQTTAPDGTTTAASFTAAAGNAEHSVVFSELVPTGDSAASVWVKTNTYSIVSFSLYGEANSLVSYNLSTATVYNQGSNVSRATITEYPNGWYRISATMNCTVSSSRVYRLYASTGNFNAGGTESFYYWGPQVETGGFETSYIPTYVSNTSVTRGDDSAVIKGTNFTDWYNQSEGTFLVESTSQPAKSRKFFNMDDNADGTGLYEMIEMANQQTDKVNIFTYDGQVTQSDIRVTPATTGRFKAAARVKQNDVQIAVDGTLGTADTSASQPSNLDRMIIGNYSSGDYTADAPIARIAYYNKALVDAQLKSLTLS